MTTVDCLSFGIGFECRKIYECTSCFCQWRAVFVMYQTYYICTITYVYENTQKKNMRLNHQLNQ